MFERTIDFARSRPMECTACSHFWPASEEWLREFNDGIAGCPSCNAKADEDFCPHFSFDQHSPLTDDDNVRNVYWYHTTTHELWPDAGFNPAADFDEDTKKRFESAGLPGGLDRWIERQKTKALHVGTYEAAIENMFRRTRNQNDSGEPFFLYRVQLRDECQIMEGILQDNQGSWGDVQLSDVCTAGTEIYRYANLHEDPTSISLGLSVDVLYKVQRIALPLPFEGQSSTLQEHVDQLWDAVNGTTTSKPSPLERIRNKVQTAGQVERHNFAVAKQSFLRSVAVKLPWAPGRNFSANMVKAGTYDERFHDFATNIERARNLIAAPESVLAELDKQPWRTVHRERERECP